MKTIIQVKKTMRNTLKTLAPAALLFSLTALAVPAQAQSAKDPAQLAAPVTTTVKDQDNPARHPVHFNTFVTFAPGQQFATTSAPFIVPAHKRLVIEMVTGEIFVPTNQQVRVSLVTFVGGTVGPNHKLIFATKSFSTGAQDILSATLLVRFYADPGTAVLLDVQRSSTTGSSGTAEVTFSGYLVNI